MNCHCVPESPLGGMWLQQEAVGRGHCVEGEEEHGSGQHWWGQMRSNHLAGSQGQSPSQA